MGPESFCCAVRSSVTPQRPHTDETRKELCPHQRTAATAVPPKACFIQLCKRTLLHTPETHTLSMMLVITSSVHWSRKCLEVCWGRNLLPLVMPWRTLWGAPKVLSAWDPNLETLGGFGTGTADLLLLEGVSPPGNTCERLSVCPLTRVDVGPGLHGTAGGTLCPDEWDYVLQTQKARAGSREMCAYIEYLCLLNDHLFKPERLFK